MNRVYWLREGEQTKVTGLVRDHAIEASRITLPANYSAVESPALQKARQTRLYIAGLKRTDAAKDDIFRKRDAHTILDQGIYPTCSDAGVTFRALMIAQDIPTSYLETFHENYITGKEFGTHAFARVLNGEQPVIVDPSFEMDPTASKMTTRNYGTGAWWDEREIFPFVVAGEGLDSWNLGIRSRQDLHEYKGQHLAELQQKLDTMRGKS